MLKRIKSILLSVAVLAGMGVQIPAVSVYAQDIPEPSKNQANVQPVSDISSEHAYDPIAELEAEKQYRESTTVVENKIIFSVIDQRPDKSKAVYLKDSDSVCKDNSLKRVSFVYETKAKNHSSEKGCTAYEVFYEAYTSEKDIWALADKLKEMAEINSAEPDFLWKNTAEGLAAEVSAEEMAKETHFPMLDVENVWGGLYQDNIRPGNGVVVAVIDTGVDYNHKDLAENMWKNPGEIPDNGIDDDGNGYIDDVYGYDFVENDGDPMDDHGHGTHVSGIIAMSPGNGGGVGLAYGAKIMAIKAGQSTGSFASTDIAKAIRYAVENGADVINMSFGGTGKSNLVESALEDAFATCVLVAAAGNDSLSTDYEEIYPAGYQYVLGVMASDNSGRLANFSNWDSAVGYRCEYEMAAPGVAIYSTLPNDKYACWSGTSMAAPNVSAAAAIIRSKYPNKNKYTSRYIMGQLVSATNDKATGPLGIQYPLLNIHDSLINQPKPNLKLTQVYMFDEPSISENDNGDGIAQPGEIIDIGLSVFNRWGVASDVTVKANAVSVGGVENPYIEIMNDTAVVGDIGTFVTGNNGFQYTDGALTGVSSPIRIRIKDGAPNDVQIKLNFEVSAKNGMDENDDTIYNIYPVPSFTITVQNGQVLNGVIKEDMTLTADKYWIIENNVLIPSNVTVTVEPGTQIQFGSALPSNPYGTSANVYLQVEGRFICEGTEEKPISFLHGNKSSSKGAAIESPSVLPILDYDTDHNYTSLKYVDIIIASEITATTIDHCNIYSSFDSVSIYSREIKNSVFYADVQLNGVNSWPVRVDNNMFCNNTINFGDSYHAIESGNVYLNCKTGKKLTSRKYTLSYDINSLISENGFVWNLFNKSTHTYRSTQKALYRFFSDADSSYYVDEEGNRWSKSGGSYSRSETSHTVYKVFEDQTESSFWDDDTKATWYLSDGETHTYYRSVAYNEYRTFDFKQGHNAYLANYNLNSPIQLRFVYTSSGHSDVDISGNYWGTTNPKLMKLQCYDADWDVSLNDLIQEPFLTLEDDMSEIYPFVTEAYLTDTDGNRTDTVNSGQNVTMHVKFNRDMAQDIQPMVTYGGSEPYTDYLLSGDWTGAREWTAQMTIDPFIDLGKMYIRVKDAVADDDRWLKTGNDKARFFFNIEKSSAQSMALQGNGEIGFNNLTWMQDDYETLAGYNLYRSTSYDKDIPLAKQGFVKVNRSVISSEECSYIDRDVEQGVDYYYYFTVADTAFKESAPSNVIMCTPVDSETPVISHKPVKAAVPNSQLAITANVTDNVAVRNVSLHYRTVGNESYTVVPMRNTSDNAYRAVISSYEVGEQPIEYYITASDGTNTAFYGTENEPVQIPVTSKHHYDNGVITVEPTCTHTGEKIYTCADCGEVRKEILPKTEHIFNGGCIKKMNSCTEDGIKIYTCINCGETYTEILKATGHDYKETVTAPTCQKQGCTEHICQNCGHVYRDNFTPQTDHHFEDETVLQAGCLVDGMIRHICRDCGYVYVEFVSKTGHEFENEVIAPTCTAPGYTVHTCKNCGYSYSDTYTTPKSHHYDDGVILQSPTLTSNGYIMYTCLECGTTINQIVPKLKPDSLKNQSVISSDTVKAGDEIVLTAKAEGGIGEYRYAAYYKSASSTSWKTIQNFSSNANIYTQIYQKGSYQICIKVKDGAGTIAKNYYDITVLPCDPLKNVSVISSTSANVGETITARCLALNGTGNYKYAVYSQLSGKNTWTTIKNFDEDSIVDMTFNKEGAYKVCLKVKDQSGTIAKVYYDIEISDSALKNLCEISEKDILRGDTVTITAGAESGSGGYKYAAYYKTLDTSWTQVHGFKSVSTIDIEFETSGIYEICIKVKDSKDTIAKKYDIINVR